MDLSNISFEELYDLHSNSGENIVKELKTRINNIFSNHIEGFKNFYKGRYEPVNFENDLRLAKYFDENKDRFLTKQSMKQIMDDLAFLSYDELMNLCYLASLGG